MSNIVIFVATNIEFRAIVSQLTNWKITNSKPLMGIGWCGENRIELICTLIGPNNAASVAQLLIKTSSQIILVVGFSGALIEKYRVGEIILYNQCKFIEQNNPIYKCDVDLNKIIRQRLERYSLQVHEGIGLTSTEMICKAKDKKKIGQVQQCIAVDMESYQIISAATKLNCKVAVMRIISDGAEHDVPNFNTALDSKFNMKFFDIFLCLGKNPLLSVRFLLNLKRAYKSLAQAINIILSSKFTTEEKTI